MLQLNILGNLGRNAETKNINGKDYLSFSVASTEKNGEQETTTWVSVLASNNTNLLPFLKKGQQVFVSGRMSAKIFQSQQSVGIDISVFAQTLQLCGGKKEEPTQTNQAPYGSTVSGNSVAGNPVPTGSAVAQPSAQPDPSSDEALPF